MAKNPKRVVEAFTGAGAAAGGIELREFTAGTLLVMQQVDSPLIGEPGAAPRKMTDMDVMRMVFILAHPNPRSFALLRGGLQAFDEAVVAFADRIRIADLPGIGARVMELYQRAMSTATGGDGAAGKKPEPTGSTPSPSGQTGLAGS